VINKKLKIIIFYFHEGINFNECLVEKGKPLLCKAERGKGAFMEKHRVTSEEE